MILEVFGGFWRFSIARSEKKLVNDFQISIFGFAVCIAKSIEG
jgi:hypothetical protein